MFRRPMGHKPTQLAQRQHPAKAYAHDVDDMMLRLEFLDRPARRRQAVTDVLVEKFWTLDI